MIFATSDDPTKLTTITITHNGQSLYWSTELYSRSRFNAANHFYDVINRYVSTWSKSRQSELFEKYRLAQMAFSDIEASVRLKTRIKSLTDEILVLVNWEELKQWCLKYKPFPIPLDLRTEHQPEDSERAKKRTYLLDDYWELVCFCLYMKFTLPLINDYIRSIYKETPQKVKEYKALSIYSQENVYTLPPIDRLKLYIEASLETEEQRLANVGIIYGVSFNELSLWLLAQCLIKEICVFEEYGDNTDIVNNAISKLHRAVTRQLEQLKKQNNSYFKSKEQSLLKTNKDDRKISKLEVYKVKQQISDGMIEMFSAFTDQMEDMVKRVDPNADLNKLHICHRNIHRGFEYHGVEPHQLTIVQWVMGRSISPRSLTLLNRKALFQTLCATQALLWHWSFHDLAILMMAKGVKQDYAFTGAKPSQLKKTHIEQIMTNYPYISLRRKVVKKITNPIVHAINLITEDLINTDWVLNGPTELMNEMQLTSNQPYVVPNEIRWYLADLINHLTVLNK